MTLKDKKTKVVNILCLYFMFKANLLDVENHPISRMDKPFQFLECLAKYLYDEAKYANYSAHKLRMDFCLENGEDSNEERGLHFQHLRAPNPSMLP